MSSMALIRDFLSQKRLAMVGISREPKDFSRTLFDELCARGYDLIPVNPAADEIAGHRCFAHLRDIPPPIDGALLMTSSDVTPGVVQECAQAGIKRVWMYRAGGAGAVNPEAVSFCKSHDIAVIPGECPFMFLPETGWFHGVHGLVRRITGRFPH